MATYEPDPLWIPPPDFVWPTPPAPLTADELAALAQLVVTRQAASVPDRGYINPYPDYLEALTLNNQRTFAQQIEQNPRHRELYFALHMKKGHSK